MLTKKNDTYKNLELSKNLKDAGLEIDIDGLSEDLEQFLRKDPREGENQENKNTKKNDNTDNT